MQVRLPSAVSAPVDAVAGAPIAAFARVGDWELVRLAAEGPHSRVFQGRPFGSAPDRPAGYAVKVLDPQWHDHAIVLKQFVREAYIGRKARGPGLITVLDECAAEPPHYLVMPWLAGDTLERLLKREGPFPSAKALWICRQVAQALGALHAVGWMHSDIKTANIHIAPTGHATLIDLGFARPQEESESIADRPLTGAPSYLAPEAITSTIRADIRSDIYSLGVVLYEMLSGRRPFEAKDFASLAIAHRQTEPRPLERLVADLPVGIPRVVHQMLSKEPLRRPQTPLDLVNALTSLEIDSFADRFRLSEMSAALRSA